MRLACADFTSPTHVHDTAQNATRQAFGRSTDQPFVCGQTLAGGKGPFVFELQAMAYGRCHHLGGLRAGSVYRNRECACSRTARTELTYLGRYHSSTKGIVDTVLELTIKFHLTLTAEGTLGVDLAEISQPHSGRISIGGGGADMLPTIVVC